MLVRTDKVHHSYTIDLLANQFTLLLFSMVAVPASCFLDAKQRSALHLLLAPAYLALNKPVRVFMLGPPGSSFDNPKVPEPLASKVVKMMGHWLISDLNRLFKLCA